MVQKPKGLKTKTALKPSSFRRKEKPKAETKPQPCPKTSQKGLNSSEALQKKTLKHIEKTRELAVKSKPGLTDWEDEFLESVSNRIKLYGRAFADPELGMTSATLSLRQGLKVKQIANKAKPKQRQDQKKKTDLD
jgi:hypothetical protein